MTVAISLAAFMPKEIRYDTFSLIAVAIVSIIIAYFKIYRPSILAHNIGELFIYGGLAAIFVRIMNLWTAALLLILISVYDFIAVFMSKHMIQILIFALQRAKNGIEKTSVFCYTDCKQSCTSNAP